ncbi:phosphorylase family protein [Acidisoma sp. C75]
MRRLGIVVGMLAEARIARASGCAVAIGGGLPLGARRMAERLVADGATGLVSFGLAGGLDPALRPGALVVPRSVIYGGKELPCDPVLREAIGGGAVGIEHILAAESVIASAAEKRRLWETTAAGAVDLESGAVAVVAAAEGIPFLALRAICDPAGRNLPRTAVTALDEAGRIAPMKMAASLARHPRDIFGLIALGRDAARARRALIRGAESLAAFAAGDANLRRTFGL